MLKIIKNTSIYTIGNILPKAAVFLLLPLYTRYLTPSEYGLVNSMNVLSAIMAIFFSMSIERSIYRLYFDYKTEEDKKNYLGTVFITMIINAFCVLIMVFLFKSLIENIYISIPFYPFYVFVIGTAFFSVFGIIPKVYYQVEQKAGMFIIITLSEFIVSTIFIVYFVVYDGKGAEGMLLGSLLSALCFLPVFVIVASRVVNFTFDYAIMKESFLFSIPLVPMVLSAWILNLSDRIFIERYYSLKDVGIYSIAYKMAEILIVFTAAFSKAYDPVFYKTAGQRNQKKAKKKLYNYNKFYSIFLIIGALGISLFSREFILILDVKYEPAIKLVPVIMIGILFAQIGGIFNMSIYQAKKTVLIMLLAVSAAVMNILLNWLLVPKFGTFGAAYSTTISFMFFFILKYVYSKKSYFIPFAWKELSVYFLFSIISVVFFYYLNFVLWLSILLKVMVMVLTISLVLINNKETLTLLIKQK